MKVRKTALDEVADGLRRKITAADYAIMARVASVDSPVLDRALPALSRAANYSRLWMGIAAGLAVSESKWGRRAALRGLASIAIASATTNVLGKRATCRLRPTSEVPLARRLSRVPRSTSFSSGHAASAAAFATGVALEVPALAAPVGALAAAVGASRVVTGVHYPSDVAAGFAIGTCAGLLTVRWWPLRRTEPAAAARPRHEAPAAPAGQGLTLVMNKSSGTMSDDLASFLQMELPDARIVVAGEGDELLELLAEAADEAQILGVAGGDGSVRLAAGLAAGRGLPLLVVPAGTFNHFATDLGVRRGHGHAGPQSRLPQLGRPRADRPHPGRVIRRAVHRRRGGDRRRRHDRAQETPSAAACVPPGPPGADVTDAPLLPAGRPN